MSKYACKGCTKRKVGCHAHCEEYLADKARNDKALAERDKFNQLAGYAKERKEQEARRHGKRKTILSGHRK